MTGTPVWSGDERQERFAEYVELVDRVLSNERTDYRGKYYTCEGAVMLPGPVQTPRPPLLIAAHGPRALLGRRLPDGFALSQLEVFPWVLSTDVKRRAACSLAHSAVTDHCVTDATRGLPADRTT